LAKRLLPALLLFFCLPSMVLAGESLELLTQNIESFTHNPDSRFAPATMTRAQAVLGAALVADRKHDAKALQESLQAAVAILASARKHVRAFKSRYRDVLQIEQAATEVTGGIPFAGLDAAEKHLHALIQAFERGDLNQSVKLAVYAKNAFKSALDAKLPSLLDKTDAALLGASRVGAKRYAPQSYKAAQKWLANALAYKDGLNSHWPRHPALGIKLANMASKLTLQIKQWRKHPDSYEQLVLQARQERLQIAKALDMDANNAFVDVNVSALIQRIKKLEELLVKDRQARKNEIAALKQLHASQLEKKLNALRNKMAKMQGKQMGDLKEAFRAKLERETFETRRQKQLHQLFKKDEVEILANLDGSLLIRLSLLKFTPGKSVIAQKYFDLLNRLKTGLDIYPDRKVRIEGHTDNKGDAKANQKLSLKRAEVVRDFLTAAGMSGGRLKALGYGEVRPIASNDYDKGRAMNRRIDIVIQAPH